MKNPFEALQMGKHAAAWEEGYTGYYVSDDNFYDQDLRNAYVDGLKARQMEIRLKMENASAWNDKSQSALNDWFLSLPQGRQKVLLDGDRWTLAGAAFEAGRDIPSERVQGGIEDLVTCVQLLMSLISVKSPEIDDALFQIKKLMDQLP